MHRVQPSEHDGVPPHPREEGLALDDHASGETQVAAGGDHFCFPAGANGSWGVGLACCCGVDGVNGVVEGWVGHDEVDIWEGEGIEGYEWAGGGGCVVDGDAGG